jgi:hypothetical protein
VDKFNKMGQNKSTFTTETFFLFFVGFGRGQLTSFHFILMKLDIISQPSSKATLPFAGLQHMQQCQVNFHSIFASMLWFK